MDDGFLALAYVARDLGAVVLQVRHAVPGAVVRRVQEFFEAGLAEGEDPGACAAGHGGGFQGLGSGMVVVGCCRGGCGRGGRLE